MQFPDRGVKDIRPYDGVYYTNRCAKCNRFITKLEILKAFEEQIPQLCPCGSRSVTPANPKLWEEILLPRSWKLWYAMKYKGLQGTCDAEAQ